MRSVLAVPVSEANELEHLVRHIHAPTNSLQVAQLQRAQLSRDTQTSNPNRHYKNYVHAAVEGAIEATWHDRLGKKVLFFYCTMLRLFFEYAATPLCSAYM